MPTILLTLALMTMAALSAPEEKAAFTAAGFKFNGKQWRQCGDPGTASYEPGFVRIVDDLNRDGRPEAIVTEGHLDVVFGEAQILPHRKP